MKTPKRHFEINWPLELSIWCDWIIWFERTINLKYLSLIFLGLNVEDAFAILTQAIYDKIESGEYRVDGEWDGIKRGFYLAAGSRINNNYPRSSRAGRNTVSLAEGTPVDRKCC